VIVGLISDTHGLVRPEVARVFAGVDRILHAGDVGSAAVLEALAKIAPVDAVYGNVDDRNDPALARERTLTHDGLAIHVSHGHELGRPTPELVLSRYSADVVVFGHTHRAVTVRTPEGRLAVNPGAAGPRRFDIVPTVARLLLRGRSDRSESPARAEVEIISLA
jgi:putative phosphoesterase